jgi:hydrogenase maturation factor
MVMMVDAGGAEDALGALEGAGVGAAVVGRVEEGGGGVEFAGGPFWPEDPVAPDVPVPPA